MLAVPVGNTGDGWRRRLPWRRSGVSTVYYSYGLHSYGLHSCGLYMAAAAMAPLGGFRQHTARGAASFTGRFLPINSTFRSRGSGPVSSINSTSAASGVGWLTARVRACVDELVCGDTCPDAGIRYGDREGNAAARPSRLLTITNMLPLTICCHN